MSATDQRRIMDQFGLEKDFKVLNSDGQVLSKCYCVINLRWSHWVDNTSRCGHVTKKAETANSEFS